MEEEIIQAVRQNFRAQKLNLKAMGLGQYGGGMLGQKGLRGMNMPSYGNQYGKLESTSLLSKILV